MITTFFMPTRIVAGAGSLATVGALARDLAMSRVLVVSDPVISQQAFHAAALTGRTTSPGIFDVLLHLGQGESIARIDDQLEPPE